MNWLYLGCISLVAFSTINIFDRKFLGEFKIHPMVFPAIATTLGTFFTFILTLIIIGWPQEIPMNVIYYGIIIGIFNFTSSSFFYWSLSQASLAKVIALDRIKLIISLIIAVLFFQEKFIWLWIPGAVLILFGNYLLIKKSNSISTKLELGALLMLISGFIGGFQIIPEKIGVTIGLPILVALVASVTRSILYILTAVIFRRHHFKHFFSRLRVVKWSMALLFRSFCSASGWVAFYYALNLALISKITPLLQLRPVLTIFFAWFFLKEKATNKRLFATIVITIGALLIIL
ncbi:MAG: DMT family transporter [Patescibacteria group bacterium]